MNKYIQSQQGELNKSIEFFKKEISSLRTGRANPAIFEGVLVEAYGSKSALNSMANISVSDSRSMLVAPWDKNVIKDIEKALVEANLGVGIVNEGTKIRITVPLMTEENRRDLVKKLNEKTEKAKISLRQIRDEIKNSIESAEEQKEIGEDDKFRFLKEMDEEIKRKTDEVEEIRKKKEEDILTI
jgi:ribosome recycling factor